MKKIVNAFTLISVSAFLLCACNNNQKPDSHEESKYIDLILLGGQSNAAGYSAILDNETETFENVRYAGMTDKTLIGNEVTIGSDFLTTKEKYRDEVTGGLGYSPNHIGPEYGMAKYLNERYGEEDELLIFKTAAGGTTMSNVSSNLSGVYGNWYPRSLWPENYEPNITTATPDNKATGILYKLFIENFKLVYNSLIEDGYEVNILGMVWSQGESDADLGGDWLANYGNLLRTFINDIRTDISEITEDEWYEDNLPFVVVKCATTYFGYNREVNFKLRTQQENVASSMNAVATVETSDLIVIQENGQRAPGCVDDWHQCFKDMVTVGQRCVDALDSLL